MTIETIIVEDEDMISGLILQCLQIKGSYDPITVCQKYEDLQSHHLDSGLFILDNNNQYGMSGVEFLSKTQIPKEKVILMSGRDGWEQLPDFKEYRFLQKPFRINELYELLNK